MGTFNEDWDAAWAASSINGSTVANAATATTAAISNDLKLDTEVSVEILYGATVNEGVKVYVLRDVDGTNYEAIADGAWGFEMAKTVSGTNRRTFTVPAQISNFKIIVSNNTGASVTATVRTRQAIGTSA